MGSIIKIEKKDIASSLEGVRRQYLVGDLKLPQKLNHIKKNDIEIGITNYSKYTTEDVHYHTDAVEYQYMISGWTKYMDVNTGEEYEFKAGDFYCIETGTAYAQKARAGTTILFIKVPSVNDKHIVELSDLVKEWYEEGLKGKRKDYAHLPEMPEANSIRPAAAVAIVNDNRILMLKRTDNSKWTLPGGTLELNESLIDCAVREVKEEAGINVVVKDIIGTYTDPNIRIEYSDGEVRREFTIVYYGESNTTTIEIDNESTEYKWISIDEVQTYPMADSQKRRLRDVVEYIKTGKKNME